MRDPHVEAVYFTVSSADDISYENPEPLSFCNHLGTFFLVDGELKVIPAEHFCNGQEASQAIEPFLQAWEIETDLKHNLGTIRFNYNRADVVDRAPPGVGEPQVVMLEGCAVIALGSNFSCHLVLNRYPQPPERFSASEYAHFAYRRWLGYRRGAEPLQAVAYFILTLLERQAGSRAQACVQFRIDRQVFNRIGELSSEKGSALTARKAKSTDFDELSHLDHEWLERAIKRLIFRLGEQVSGGSLELITLDNVDRF